MKIVPSALVKALVVAAGVSGHPVAASSSPFQPFRVTFDALVGKEKVPVDGLHRDLLRALTDVGMVSITGLPQPGRDSLTKMLASQHECIMINKNKNSDGAASSSNIQEQTFADGTVRRTIATHTLPTAGMVPVELKDNKEGPCHDFKESSAIVRDYVERVVSNFAYQVTDFLVTDRPLLVTNDNSGAVYNTFEEVFEHGEQLEHFHSYHKAAATKEESNTSTGKTIDLHTDQGLFLTFTPGRRENGVDLTSGFYIQLANGEISEVAFTEHDDLVILLGDGVNQYINNKISTVGDAEEHRPLRAVPHALKLDGNDQARVWYGRMSLPPANALHPVYTTKTFHELRTGLMEPDNQEAIHMACSHPHGTDEDSASSSASFTTVMTQRTLHGDDDCNSTVALLCWHRCMSYTEYGVSADLCSASSETIQCVNPRGQLSNGTQHGDFFLSCAAANTPFETPFPTLPEYGQDRISCSTFGDFVTGTADGITYNHSVQLRGDSDAVFQWSVTSDDMIVGRIAFDGIFGYLAVGLAGTGGDIPNMSGARIVMATRGPYNATAGYDLSSDPVLESYIISTNASTFRIWGTPYVDIASGTGAAATATQRSSSSGGGGRALHEVSLNHTFDGCHTSLTFTTGTFADKAVNVTGTDALVWAANDVDSYAQYHGNNRGVFRVNWATGESSSGEQGTTGAGGNAAGNGTAAGAKTSGAFTKRTIGAAAATAAFSMVVALLLPFAM
jgi:hypothetical protein